MWPRSRRARALLLVAWVALALGCDEDEGPPPTLEADIERLRMLMIDDPALQPLDEAEALVDERPVHAARMLRTGGIPAARRQVARVEEAQMATEQGRGLARRLAAAYRDRVSALEDYREVLEGGSADSEGLMRALHAQAAADRAVLDVDAQMEQIVPTGPPRPSGGQPLDALEDEEPEGPPLGGGASR